jgi:putative membrane protein
MRSLHLAAATMLALAPLAASAQEASEPAAAAGVDEFALVAARNSLTEVLMSTMALQKTSDRRVEEHAWTMLDHHGRAMGDLAEALSPEAAVLPTEPSAEQAAMLEEMREMDGAEFDEAYLLHQLDAHGRAVAVFEQGAQVPDEEVAQYARTTLPILRAHLEIAEMRHAQPPQPIPGQ